MRINSHNNLYSKGNISSVGNENINMQVFMFIHIVHKSYRRGRERERMRERCQKEREKKRVNSKIEKNNQRKKNRKICKYEKKKNITFP